MQSIPTYASTNLVARRQRTDCETYRQLQTPRNPLHCARKSTNTWKAFRLRSEKDCSRFCHATGNEIVLGTRDEQLSYQMVRSERCSLRSHDETRRRETARAARRSHRLLFSTTACGHHARMERDTHVLRYTKLATSCKQNVRTTRRSARKRGSKDSH